MPVLHEIPIPDNLPHPTPHPQRPLREHLLVIENELKQLLRSDDQTGEYFIHFSSCLLAVNLEYGREREEHGPHVDEICLQRLDHVLEGEVGEAGVGRGLEEV